MDVARVSPAHRSRVEGWCVQSVLKVPAPALMTHFAMNAVPFDPALKVVLIVIADVLAAGFEKAKAKGWGPLPEATGS